MENNTINLTPLLAKQQAIIEYSAPRPVAIGDVFYFLEQADYQVFREPCLVCKDEKKLTVNGVTFKCPCCGDAKETIKLHKYVVRRYRVYEISQSAPHDDWKASDMRQVKFKLYRKSGRGYAYAAFDTKMITPDQLRRWFNPPAEAVSAVLCANYIFDNYSLAVRAADFLTSQELTRLEEYNKLHGTTHIAGFSSTHDKKSN